MGQKIVGDTRLSTPGSNEEKGRSGRCLTYLQETRYPWLSPLQSG
jgi:hypothetical protein